MKIIKFFPVVFIIGMFLQMHVYASAELTFGKISNGRFESIEDLDVGNISLQARITNDSGHGKSYTIKIKEYRNETETSEIVRNLYLDSGADSTTYTSRVISDDKTMLSANITENRTDEVIAEAEVIEKTTDTRPDASEILSNCRAYTSDEPHPRIMVRGKEEFNLIKEKVNTDAFAGELNKKVLSACDTVLTEDVCSYDDNDPRRILSANTVFDRLIKLSYAYKITGDTRYLDRAVLEIENVISWDNWNIYVEALNTSAICTGLSIAYDWLYDDLSDTLKSEIRNAVYDKAFKVLLAKYPNNGIGWMSCKTNWNFVCNSGFAVTALTFFDEDGWYSNCENILNYAAERLDNVTEYLKDDGSWYEGIGYWDYAMQYFAMYLSSLRTASGSDYHYSRIEGMRETGLFPVYMTGYKNSFNLNDSSASPVSGASLMYFAYRYGDGTVYKFRKTQLLNSWVTPTVYDIIWLGNSSDYMYKDVEDKFYGGDNQIAVFKSGGTAINKKQTETGERLQSAVMLHGGVNNVNHGHIDAGSFIYESQGVRWAIDMGASNYNLYNYFASDNTEKSRWSYYKVRGEAHNTVIVNPGLLADQDLNAPAIINRFESNRDYGYAVVDMSGVLNLNNAQRGVYFDKTTGGLLVQDELTLQNESTVYWMFNTDSTIDSISEDGKTAYLSRGSARLYVKILSDDASFDKYDPAQILPTSPNPDEWEENINPTVSSNPGKQQVYGRKIFIKLSEAVGDKKIAVYIAPLLTDSATEPEGTIPEVTSISDWK